MVRSKATPQQKKPDNAEEARQKKLRSILARGPVDEWPQRMPAERRAVPLGTDASSKLLLKLPSDVFRRIVAKLSMRSLCRLTVTASVVTIEDGVWRGVAAKMVDADPDSLRCTTGWKSACVDLYTLRVAEWRKVQCSGAAPNARSGHTAARVGAFLYVMGGVSNIHGDDAEGVGGTLVLNQQMLSYGHSRVHVADTRPPLSLDAIPRLPAVFFNLTQM